MTQQEITEYNKRCAEFLGSELKNDGQYDYWTYDHLGFDSMKIRGSSWISGNFEFHSDWNWIMEVVESIEKLGYSLEIKVQTCVISDNFACNENFKDIIKSSIKSKEMSVVQAINQFLIWYNEQAN